MNSCPARVVEKDVGSTSMLSLFFLFPNFRSNLLTILMIVAGNN